MSYHNRDKSDRGGVPERWLKCPRKAEAFIAEKFLVFKTPLSSRYNDQVPVQHRFLSKIIFDYMHIKKLKLGLWIDLTNTTRFYPREEVEANGVTYTKLNCKGHGEAPQEAQIDAFIEVCTNFIKSNNTDYIGVHCTHGFNRSGFLVCCFLIKEFDFSVMAALALFAKCRPPGIYKQDYINILWNMFKEPHDPPPPQAPPLPDWCFDDEEGGNGPSTSMSIIGNGKRTYDQANNDNGRHMYNGEVKRRRGEIIKENPTFMAGISNVYPITDRDELVSLQRRVQEMCGWQSTGFPGSQPVSMDARNIHKLSQKQYMVSWKADGTRYLMLIEGPGRVYFIDRDNSIFKANNITFPCKKDLLDHVYGTLVDGEMVIDNVNGTLVPRYLIYDIIQFRGIETGKCDFRVRLSCIRDEIVTPRYKAIEAGIIDRAAEPFGVRFKTFWFVEDTERILEGTFVQELLHEPDGLVFQPAKDPYVCGRCDDVLKWKPSELNTIDFRLKVVTETGQGILPTKIGELYVGSLKTPFSSMKPCPKAVQKFDGCIIECRFDGRSWIFLRERTDKSFPNAYNTAQGVIFSIQHPVTKDYLLEFIAVRRFRKQSMI